MKIAVCVAPAGADSYGHLSRYAEQLAAAGRRRGVSVEILRFPSDDFFARLFANLADEECIVHFYGYLYDLRVAASVAPDGFVHALENSRATTVATIGDHPFSSFMQPMIVNAHPRTRFIVMDRSFRDEMCALNPALAHSHYEYRPITPPINYEASLLTDFKDRDFDLLVPMYVTDMSHIGLDFIVAQAAADWFKNVIVATYERASVETNLSPFHILMECLQAELGPITFDDIRGQNPNFVGEIMMSVAAIDALVRQDRRRKIITSLLKSVGDLKVAVTCDPIPALQVDDNVSFVGMRPVSDVVELMANTRALLNCNPSYPTGLHERVISGMLYNSCVITDLNPFMSETFSPSELVPYAPNESMTLPDIFKTWDVEAIAAAGGEKVRNDPAFSWDAHLDGLQSAAA